LKFLCRVIEGLVHGLRVHFHPQQFSAWRQIFDGNIHNSFRWLESRAA
jgi:hypothetical protein